MVNTAQKLLFTRGLWAALVGLFFSGSSLFSAQAPQLNDGHPVVCLPADMKGEFCESDFVIVQFERETLDSESFTVHVLATTVPQLNSIILDQLRSSDVRLPNQGQIFRQRIALH